MLLSIFHLRFVFQIFGLVDAKNVIDKTKFPSPEEALTGRSERMNVSERPRVVILEL